MYYGLLKEPDINLQIDENEEQGEDDSEKPKVYKLFKIYFKLFLQLSNQKSKKKKKDPLLNKKNRQDPNAPSFNRIPLPELYVFAYKMENVQ